MCILYFSLFVWCCRRNDDVIKRRGKAKFDHLYTLLLNHPANGRVIVRPLQTPTLNADQ